MFDDHDEPSRLGGERPPNPFTPVSYDERLRAPLKRAEYGAADIPMRPGQYYTGSYDKWLSRPAPLLPLSGASEYASSSADRYEPPRQAEPLRFHEPVPRQESELEYSFQTPVKPSIPGYLQKARQLTPLKPDKQATSTDVTEGAYAPRGGYDSWNGYPDRDACAPISSYAPTDVYASRQSAAYPQAPAFEAQTLEAQPFVPQPFEAQTLEPQSFESQSFVPQPLEPLPLKAQPVDVRLTEAPAATQVGAARRSRSQRKEQPARRRRADRHNTSTDAGESSKAPEHSPYEPQTLSEDFSNEYDPWDEAPQQSNITAFPTQADTPAQAYEPQAGELAGFEPDSVEAYSSGRSVEAELTEPMDEIASFFSDRTPELIQDLSADRQADYDTDYAPDPMPEIIQDFPSDHTPDPFASSTPERFEPQAASPPPDAPKPNGEQIKRADISPIHVDYDKLESKRRIRPLRLAALISIVGMLAFVIIVGGGILSDLARNRQEMSDFREAYKEQNGVSPEHDGHMVSLLPFGQTFAPSATPVPIATPSPDGASQQNLDGTATQSPDDAQIQDSANGGGNADQSTSATESTEPAAASPARTRLKAYPHNPLMNKLTSITDLQSDNADIVGRLVIDGVLDEVVVQRNNTYYLTHNYRGGASVTGAVFIDEGCSLKSPPENLLLRGQATEEGKIFAPLWQFSIGGSAFVSTATRATLTTLYEEAEYVLFAVIQTSSQAATGFNYAGHPSFASDEEMLAHVNSAISQSQYKFRVSVDASDRLLTLATIGSEDKTLVLMYRMVRDDER